MVDPRRTSGARPILNLGTPLLALASALSWGIGDFCGGMASRWSHALVAVVGSQGLGLLAAALAVLSGGERMPPTEALGWAAIGGAFGAVGVAAFYLALSRGTMALVAPMTALIGAAIPATVGLVSGEPASPRLLTGLVVALIAVVLISIPDRSSTEPLAASSIPDGTTPTSRAAPRRLEELFLIVVAGCGFAGFFLGLDQSRVTGGETFWPLLAARMAGLAAAAATAIVVLRVAPLGHVKLTVTLAAVVLLAALGDLGGNLFYILANQGGELAVSVVLSSLYPVATAILARVFLHERLTGVRLAGVVAAMIGVVLIALG